jgi:ABC-type nickel/cobalt efflux system permease component RcnA
VAAISIVVIGGWMLLGRSDDVVRDDLGPADHGTTMTTADSHDHAPSQAHPHERHMRTPHPHPHPHARVQHHVAQPVRPRARGWPHPVDERAA